MKRLLILSFLLFLFSLNSFAQPRGPFAQQDFTYDLSKGNTVLTTGKFLGFSRLSFQLVTTDLDMGGLVIQIKKSNDHDNYLDIAGATLEFDIGTNINFIEIENAKNARYKIILTVNSVTLGTINITLVATR